jgi:hypothetical protein
MRHGKVQYYTSYPTEALELTVASTQNHHALLNQAMTPPAGCMGFAISTAQILNNRQWRMEEVRRRTWESGHKLEVSVMAREGRVVTIRRGAE